MKKHYETHVEDTDKLISVAGPILEYKSWYEQYRKLMEEQAQRKYGLYTPTSEGNEDDFPSISGMIARYSTLEEDDNSDIVYPFPTYDATSTEFNSLITSDEWSTNTKDYDI